MAFQDASPERRSYKRYLQDPTRPIPRSTRYRWASVKSTENLQQQQHATTNSRQCAKPHTNVEPSIVRGTDSHIDSGDEDPQEDNCPDDQTVSLLRREVCALKDIVENLSTSNTMLLEAVASLSYLPSIVEKLGENVRKFCDTQHNMFTERAPFPLSDTPNLPAQPTTIVCDNNERHEEPSADPRSHNSPAPTDTDIVHGSSYAEFSISMDLLKTSIKTDARKMTNDLMRRLYSEEFMASHSVSGGGNGKPAIPQCEVSAIISAVLGQFGETVRPTDVSFYMREKLNNAIKVQRRKQKKRVVPASTSSAGSTPSVGSTRPAGSTSSAYSTTSPGSTPSTDYTPSAGTTI